MSGSAIYESVSFFQEKDIPFDGWQLKKSILNTIFQAVKAIAGGVTAINGQIIKGGGHILSHGGKVGSPTFIHIFIWNQLIYFWNLIAVDCGIW